MYYQVSFMIYFFYYYGEFHWGLDKDCSESTPCFRQYSSPNNLTFLIDKHRKSFHFVPFIFFSSILLAFIPHAGLSLFCYTYSHAFNSVWYSGKQDCLFFFLFLLLQYLCSKNINFVCQFWNLPLTCFILLRLCLLLESLWFLVCLMASMVVESLCSYLMP